MKIVLARVLSQANGTSDRPGTSLLGIMEVTYS